MLSSFTFFSHFCQKKNRIIKNDFFIRLIIRENWSTQTRIFLTIFYFPDRNKFRRLLRLLVEQQLKPLRRVAQKKSSKARFSAWQANFLGEKSWGKIFREKSESREIVPCALNTWNGVSRRHSPLTIFSNKCCFIYVSTWRKFFILFYKHMLMLTRSINNLHMKKQMF